MNLRSTLMRIVFVCIFAAATLLASTQPSSAGPLSPGPRASTTTTYSTTK